ncbi:MAG: hypothetical protein IH859_03055 [Chloroflexi bacterium]|nr:hypothetical protein [Chloroflexota bacterium]
MTDQAQATFPDRKVNVNKLGLYLDGWADLVEGMGKKVELVKDQVHQLLTDRHMPDVQVEKITGVVGLISDKREYSITTTQPGATTTIFVGEHGKDLFIAWHTYLRPVLNYRLLLVMLGIATVLGLCQGLAIFVPGMGAAESDFVTEFNLFGPITVLILSGSCFAVVTFAIFAVEASILLVAGYFLKSSPLGFFFIEPNVFDADDITAMSLSVHKSVLKALDKVGIDSALLRRKEEFRRKRGETI